MSDLFSLAGKRALVTGSSSGLGRRMAFAMAKAGADVIIHGRNAGRLAQAAGEIASETGREVEQLVVDLQTVDDWDEFVQDFEIRADILANVAGINLRQPPDEISSESWDQTLNINLKIPFFLARALVPQMRVKGWGKVINIGSLQSSRAFANSFPYGASKGGVVQLTRAMAEAWSKDGIGCNAIAPGFFPTELTRPVYDNVELVQKNASQTAIGRNGELEDVDGVTVFLASSASDYITGQTIYLDGGFTAK